MSSKNKTYIHLKLDEVLELYRNGELKEALKKATLVEKLCKVKKQHFFQAHAIRYIARIYLELGEQAKAEEFSVKSIAIAKKSKREEVLVQNIVLLADIFQIRNKHNETLKLFREFKAHLEKDKLHYINVLLIKGKAHVSLKNEELGLKDFALANEICKSLSPQMYKHKAVNYKSFQEFESFFLSMIAAVLARINLNIGIVLSNQLKYKKALKYFNDVEKLFNSYPIEINIYITLLDFKGFVYHGLGSLNEAINCLQNSLKIREEKGMFFDVEDTFNAIIDVYVSQKEYENALKHIKRGIEVSSSLLKQNSNNDFLIRLAEVYFLQNKLKLSASTLQKCLHENDVFTELQLAKAWKLFSQIHEKNGDFLNTINALKKYSEFSALAYEKDKELQLAQLKQDFYFKEKEIEIEKQLHINSLLSSFTRTASHDMQEPLRTISSFSTLLLNNEYFKSRPNTIEVQYLNNISGTVKKLQHLLKSLLIYAKAGANTVSKHIVSLNAVIDEVEKNMFDVIKQSKTLIVCKELPNVYGHEDALIQLFNNIFTNSVKYAQKGRQPIIEVDNISGNETHVVTISDNGMGMSTEQTNEALDVFKRFNTETEGSGLGLSICKKIIESYGGKISIESKQNVGTKILLYFPKI